MNYYMPYFNAYPTMGMVSSPIASTASKGLFSKLLGGFNWGAILTNTQKTLGLVNQAIPVIKQVSPVMKNAKTMFRVMNEFKKVDTPSNTSKINNTNIKETPNTEIIEDNYSGGPTFFVN